MGKNDIHRYDNLIDLEKPKAKNPMSLLGRAAQFAPFAALTGYEDQIVETARLTDNEIEISEGEVNRINSQLYYLNTIIEKHPYIRLTYFIPDNEINKGSNKSGGAYVIHEGRVEKIDTDNKNIVFSDLLYVQIERIVSIEGQIFESWEN